MFSQKQIANMLTKSLSTSQFNTLMFKLSLYDIRQTPTWENDEQLLYWDYANDYAT